MDQQGANYHNLNPRKNLVHGWTQCMESGKLKIQQILHFQCFRLSSIIRGYIYYGTSMSSEIVTIVHKSHSSRVSDEASQLLVIFMAQQGILDLKPICWLWHHYGYISFSVSLQLYVQKLILPKIFPITWKFLAAICA